MALLDIRNLNIEIQTPNGRMKNCGRRQSFA